MPSFPCISAALRLDFDKTCGPATSLVACRNTGHRCSLCSWSESSFGDRLRAEPRRLLQMCSELLCSLREVWSRDGSRPRSWLRGAAHRAFLGDKWSISHSKRASRRHICENTQPYFAFAEFCKDFGSLTWRSRNDVLQLEQSLDLTTEHHKPTVGLDRTVRSLSAFALDKFMWYGTKWLGSGLFWRQFEPSMFRLMQEAGKRSICQNKCQSHLSNVEFS